VFFGVAEILLLTLTEQFVDLARFFSHGSMSTVVMLVMSAGNDIKVDYEYKESTLPFVCLRYSDGIRIAGYSSSD